MLRRRTRPTARARNHLDPGGDPFPDPRHVGRGLGVAVGIKADRAHPGRVRDAGLADEPAVADDHPAGPRGPGFDSLTVNRTAGSTVAWAGRMFADLEARPGRRFSPPDERLNPLAIEYVAVRSAGHYWCWRRPGDPHRLPRLDARTLLRPAAAGPGRPLLPGSCVDKTSTRSGLHPDAGIAWPKNTEAGQRAVREMRRPEVPVAVPRAESDARADSPTTGGWDEVSGGIAGRHVARSQAARARTRTRARRAERRCPNCGPRAAPAALTRVRPGGPWGFRDAVGGHDVRAAREGSRMRFLGQPWPGRGLHAAVRAVCPTGIGDSTRILRTAAKPPRPPAGGSKGVDGLARRRLRRRLVRWPSIRPTT